LTGELEKSLIFSSIVPPWQNVKITVLRPSVALSVAKASPSGVE